MDVKRTCVYSLSLSVNCVKGKQMRVEMKSSNHRFRYSLAINYWLSLVITDQEASRNPLPTNVFFIFSSNAVMGHNALILFLTLASHTHSKKEDTNFLCLIFLPMNKKKIPHRQHIGGIRLRSSLNHPFKGPKIKLEKKKETNWDRKRDLEGCLGH